MIRLPLLTNCGCIQLVRFHRWKRRSGGREASAEATRLLESLTLLIDPISGLRDNSQDHLLILPLSLPPGPS